IQLKTESGSSLKLTCQVSGYSLTDSSYYTNWIRQLPQRTLEWLGYINYGGGTSYASSVQGRFTITKSSSSLSLEMRSLTEADSAVYYCARGAHHSGSATSSHNCCYALWRPGIISSVLPA
uniref:Ig-like domain-containing protein n=1 Tax=Erpetoichthys calabaricus TaxID=27687 RepID=A0A8C4RF23_ERPCA